MAEYKVRKDENGQWLDARGPDVPSEVAPVGSKFTDTDDNKKYVRTALGWVPLPEVKAAAAELSASDLAGGVLTYVGLVPANVVVVGVTSRVLTALSGGSVTQTRLGITGTLAKYAALGARIALDKASLYVGSDLVTAATDVILGPFQVDGTTPATITAGKVRVVVYYIPIAAEPGTTVV